MDSFGAVCGGASEEAVTPGVSVLIDPVVHPVPPSASATAPTNGNKGA